MVDRNLARCVVVSSPASLSRKCNTVHEPLPLIEVRPVSLRSTIPLSRLLMRLPEKVRTPPAGPWEGPSIGMFRVVDSGNSGDARHRRLGKKAEGVGDIEDPAAFDQRLADRNVLIGRGSLSSLAEDHAAGEQQRRGMHLAQRGVAQDAGECGRAGRASRSRSSRIGRSLPRSGQ